MDWYTSRSNEHWLFTYVNPRTMQDSGVYENGVDCTYEYSFFTELKASGTLSFIGFPPAEDRYLRVYYCATDDHGDSVQEAVGTFRVEAQSPTWKRDVNTLTGKVVVDPYQDGEVSLLSILKVLDDKVYGMPYTVKAGVGAVAKAKQLAESLGLSVYADDSGYVMPCDITYEPDKTYLYIINDLLARAGFSSAFPDSYGYVRYKKYVDPIKRGSVLNFSDDGNGVLYDGVTVENDFRETPNVVAMCYEGEDFTVWAKATNVDPEHKASTLHRAELTLYEAWANTQEGQTAQQVLNEMQAACDIKLVENSADITYIDISHGLIPENLQDGSTVEYAGQTWEGSVTNFKMGGGRPIKIDTRIRHYVEPTFKRKLTGGSF